LDSLVLGTGLSGLITGYILGWPVVGRGLGGQQSSSFPLGPRILEKTPDTEWLLGRLGIEATPREFRIGYYSPDLDNPWVDNPPSYFRAEYYKKTRGTDDVTLSSMSGGRNSIIGWDLNELNLVSRLLSRVPVIPQLVLKVETYPVKRLLLGNKQSVDGMDVLVPERVLYPDNIINTIPLPIFLRLMNLDEVALEFKALPTMFVEVVSLEPLFEYDYGYISTPTIPVHRITKISPQKYVLECRGDKGYNPVELGIHNTVYNRHKIVPDCQIVQSKCVQEYAGVKMIGRYAEWDHSVKLEDVIRRARECYSELNGKKL
jgi:hypothetical protein